MLNHRFHIFVSDLLNRLFEEKAWNVWIHKVHDKSYSEFITSIHETPMPIEKMTDDEIKATILDSKSMLESFTPNNEGRG